MEATAILAGDAGVIQLIGDPLIGYPLPPQRYDLLDGLLLARLNDQLVALAGIAERDLIVDLLPDPLGGECDDLVVAVALVVECRPAGS